MQGWRLAGKHPFVGACLEQPARPRDGPRTSSDVSRATPLSLIISAMLNAVYHGDRHALNVMIYSVQ